ncbi:hypothetical protein [Nocardioides sp.]|uniref:hypothetical protein n=1 Tax=Nocardioides sp. TaxID=35761 RepID=UPI00356AB86D
MSQVERAWVQHLRLGGTTPWPEFALGESRWAGETRVPGAQSLELLRRVNQAGAPSAGLVERLLTTEPRGRGRPPLGLLHPDLQPHASHGPQGAPRVDPGELDPRELLRVATTLIAEDLRDAGTQASPRARPKRWRPAYRLAGDPWLAAGARHALTAAGYPPGGRTPRVLVLADRLDQMVVDCWLARCFGQGGPPWPSFRSALAHGNLPPRADLGLMVERRVAESGVDRVQVVLDPASLAGAAGVRRGLAGVRGEAPRVPHHAAEVARRVAGALGGLVSPDQASVLMRGTLLSRLSRATGPATAVGPAHHQSLREAAVRMTGQVQRTGVAVHGSLDSVIPAEPASVDHEADTPAAALTLAIDLLLDPVRRNGEG